MNLITVNGQTYKVLNVDGDTITVTPAATEHVPYTSNTVSQFVAGDRVRYHNGRTGTVRNTYIAYGGEHGAQVDWDEKSRASSVLQRTLTAI